MSEQRLAAAWWPGKPAGKSIQDIKERKTKRAAEQDAAEKKSAREQLIKSVNSALLDFAISMSTRVNAVLKFERDTKRQNVLSGEQITELDRLLDALVLRTNQNLAEVASEIKGKPGLARVYSVAKNLGVNIAVNWTAGEFKVDPYTAYTDSEQK